MGYKKRAATTGKVEVPDALKEEIGLTFHYDIVSKIRKYNIPPSLVINLVQTPSKFVPGNRSTQAAIGSKTVAIAGSTDKRMITLTFCITLKGDFLPMQIIYGGKTSQSIPRVSFPDSFCLCVNEKHYSNEAESLKLIDEIIIPHIQKERKKLDQENQKQEALLIMDVFRGQKTDAVFKKLKKNNILVSLVPANMTHLFQPLDLTVNGYFKQCMKRKFIEWYSNEVMMRLDDGENLESIEIKFKLSTMKPLHAKWLMEAYDHMTTATGRDICLKGWERSGILQAIENGVSDISSLDPFFEIDPIEDETIQQKVTSFNGSIDKAYIADHYEHNDSDSEWEDDDGNIFNVFNIENDE